MNTRGGELCQTGRLFDDDQRAWICEHLAAVVDAEQFSQALFVERFEREFAAFVGRRHAVAVSSGSVALELGIRALRRRQPLRRAVYPSLTVPMVPWALARGGVTPVALDVTDGFLPDATVFAEKARHRCCGVIVWTAGLMSMSLVEAIRELRAEGIPILEDASHAHGCTVAGNMAGTLGDIAAFSLYSTKVITCGEGGILVTDDDDAAAWLRQFANQGKPRGSLRVETEGWNCRMTEMQAVVGTSCLQFWQQMLRARSQIAQCYAEVGIASVQREVPELHPTWYKYTVRVPDADAAMAAIRAAGGRTSSRTHSHEDNQCRSFGFPGADRLANGHISLPTAWLNAAEAERIAAAVRRSGVLPAR